MKKIAFSLLIVLTFAGLNSGNAFNSNADSETILQDTTKKDTTKTPADTLKTPAPKQ